MYTHDTDWPATYTFYEANGTTPYDLTGAEAVGLRFIGPGGFLFEVRVSEAALAFTGDGSDGQVTFTCPTPSPWTHYGAGTYTVQGFILQSTTPGDYRIFGADTFTLDQRAGGTRNFSAP